MKIYGYFDNGVLKTREITDTVRAVKGSDGKMYSEPYTVEDQIKDLDLNIWKPVDPIEDDRLNNHNRIGYTIRIEPYDAGDHIALRYVEVVDRFYYNQMVTSLKKKLSDSDYKVIKCYEASLAGLSMPYDVQEIHNERQALRDRINELDEEYKKNISNELDN